MAVAAACSFGLAAVLQGIATRETPSAGGVDPALLLRMLRRPVFLAAVLLNLLGFALHVTALQTLPLFLVQAIISSSVAVTAVVSVRVFDAPLTRAQWVSVGAVLVGLAMLGPTAASGTADGVGGGATAALLAVVLAAAALSVAAVRLPPSPSAVVLGLLAGSAFGVVAVSARLLPDLSPLALVREADAYVLALAGLVAFQLYSSAMQRGSVTTATASLVLTQTAVPALVGVVLLGDTVRDGLLPLAVAGFAVALGGALGLARFEAGAPVAQV